MEVYEKIKKDIVIMILVVLMSQFLYTIFGLFKDETDKSNTVRSGAKLIIDYGTGMHYLYKGGSMIPRLDKNGNHVHSEQI